MYGQNPVKKRVHSDKLQVAEIFWTIQGEGPYSGHAAVFVRLTGCNLQCEFCDTKWDDDHDQYMTPDEVVTEVLQCCAHVPDLVVLTGGEPLRQDLDTLFKLLLNQGIKIQVETAGTLWQDCLRWGGVTVVVSPKKPSVNKKIAYCAKHWKYPLQAHEMDIDGLPAKTARPPEDIAHTIYITPCEDRDPDKTAANIQQVVKSCQAFGYIAQLQIHKYLEIR